MHSLLARELAFVLVAGFGASPVSGAPQSLQCERFKLLANDGHNLDAFGNSVAISGTTALVGSVQDDDNGNGSGSAYLFDTTTGQQVGKLLAGDGAPGDQFGTSVAISGTTAIVGAERDDDNGTSSGSAYLFDTTTGQQTAKLLANPGSADDLFGHSVAISGTTAIVGAPGHGPSGSAFIFDTTTGQQLALLVPLDLPLGFGWSVAISGSRAVIGAPSDDDNGMFSGSAYVFDTITFQQIAKLLATDGAADDDFGVSVSISGTTAIVGAWGDAPSGSAYLFEATTGQQVAKLLASDGVPGNYFGRSVAISGTNAIVGAQHDDTNGVFAGSAYLFDTTTFQQTAKVLPTDGMGTDYFSASVAISGSTAIGGALGDDDNGFDSGSAYVFDSGEPPGTPFCFGDVGCPCGNEDLRGIAGCFNSTGRGAILCGTGTTSVAADDLVLTIHNIPSPNANGIIFMGPSVLPPFVPLSADGFACTGGGLRFPGILDDNVPPNRLVQENIVGTAAANAFTIGAGDTWHFQGWFRDNGGLCTVPSSNLSNAYSMTFTP